MAAPSLAVMCSTPITSTMRACFAAISLMPWCTAAEPVAQVFSTRVAGLKRKAGSMPKLSEEGKSWAEKTALKWPTKIASTSLGATPACFSAEAPASTIMLSMSLSACLPNGRCDQPMIEVPVIALVLLLQRLLEPHRLAERRADQLIVAHHDAAAHDGRLGPASHVHAVERRPAALVLHHRVGDGALGLQVHHREIRIVAKGNAALARYVVDARWTRAGQVDETLQSEPAGVDVIQHHRDHGLHARHA